MDESSLPLPFQNSLNILRKEGMEGVRMDAIKDNFAYIWFPSIVLDPSRYPPPLIRGLWVRIPIQLRNPDDITEVVSWVERRIRIA